MALQASGTPISFNQIINEFGPSDPTATALFKSSLGNYRINDPVGEMLNLGLDNEINSSGVATSLIPQAGTIKFSDFYGKRLNVIVDCYSPEVNEKTRINAKTRYIDNHVKVMGDFIDRPFSTTGKKVFIHVAVDIGSVKNNDARYVALNTDTWDPDTILNIDIGPSGRIFGAGGDGGNGAPSSGNGFDGGSGTSGLGIKYNITNLSNRGLISAGFAGGGGGGGGYSDPSKTGDDPVIGGSGGGGGAGFPSGSGGTVPNVGKGAAGYGPSGGPGNAGNAGTKIVKGLGGASKSSSPTAGSTGGKGGDGGDVTVNAEKGGNGSGNMGAGTGGNPGSNGNAIRIISGVSILTTTGSNTVYGSSATGVEVL